MSDIEIAREGGVLSAAFARPQKKNAITGAMYETLIEAFDTAERDPAIGALALSGRGGASPPATTSPIFLASPRGGKAIFPPGGSCSRLASFEKPLVAAVDGLAIGVGTTLLFHCDLVYATREARFQMPFVDLGLVPEAGSSLLAPQRFGRAKAAEFLMLGEPFGADEALRLGLVNAILPQSELLAHAMEKAAALAAKPRAALLATRRLMRGDAEAIKARMAEETHAFSAALKSPEAHAAFQAFSLGGGSRGARHCKLRRSDPEPRVRAFIPGSPRLACRGAPARVGSIAWRSPPIQIAPADPTKSMNMEMTVPRDLYLCITVANPKEARLRH